MFLLQKILSDTNLKEIVAEQTARNKLSKQTPSSYFNVNGISVEKEKYTCKLFEKLRVLREAKKQKSHKKIKNVVRCSIIKNFRSVSNLSKQAVCN